MRPRGSQTAGNGIFVGTTFDDTPFLGHPAGGPPPTTVLVDHGPGQAVDNNPFQYEIHELLRFHNNDQSIT